ncbi:type VII secretion integral membrane protein EccD [Corynebacterium sp. NPDC060344]|uniref:type VII secretion integral membrane protein EccD n=1 Tax=Corynebacterium sp. NPDC060344 TaxID=3347101 RepID=UPI00365BCA4D
MSHTATTRANMLRIRADLLAGDGAGTRRADLLVPAHAPVAAVLPEMIDVIGAGDAPGASWRVRLPDGTVADPEIGLADAGVCDGDRIVIADDPGPAPPPMVVDVADVLADDAPGVGVADAAVGLVVAAAATAVAVAGVLAMSPHDAVLAAGVAGLLALAAGGGLRIALRRGGSAAAALLLACQVLVLAAVAGAALTGIPAGGAGADWRFAAGLIPGGLVASLALLVLRPARRDVAAALTVAGSAGAAAAIGAAGFAAGLAWFDALVPAAALAIAVAVIGLAAAPGIGVAVAGVRVPRIPAAGEPFPDDPDPDDPVDVIASRAGRLLDGMVAGAAMVLVAAAAPIVAGSPGGWAIGLLAAVTVLCLIQSRSHARLIPSAALACAGALLLVGLALSQWDAGRWAIALLILAPLLAATAITAVPATRITPTMRRILELVEAVAIAVSLPLAAVVAGIPDLAAGLIR